MLKKMAVIDFSRCLPEQCDSGICAASLACPHKLLKQEAVNEIPMAHPSSICQGCAKCVVACPLKAIQIN